MKDEDHVYKILLDEKNKNKIKVELKRPEILPLYKFKDSPDFILNLHLEITVFNRNFDLTLPIPIEVEKAGVDFALEDLEKFIKRQHYLIRIPMIVISGKLCRDITVLKKPSVEFNIRCLQEWQIHLNKNE